MIFGALLLALLGSVESTWKHLHRLRFKISLSIVSWIALILIAVFVLGLRPVWAVGAVVVASVLAVAFRRTRRPRGVLVSFVVLVAAVALTSSATPASPQPQVMSAYDMGAQPLSELGLGIEAVVVFGALVLFLGDAANTVVKAVLDVAGVAPRAKPGIATPEPAARRSRFSRRRETLQGAPTTSPPEVFRGGRYIGALERWLVLVLLPLGALPVVVALLAAKGIVRFPEVSKDADDGTTAEYFLVGTLTSFGIALAAAGCLTLAL